MKTNFTFTSHAVRRMAQRGITKAQVQLVLKFAFKIHRQGMLFHIMRDKDLALVNDAHQKGRIKRMVVITSLDAVPAVITAYRSRDALKNVKCKSKMML